MFAFAAFPKYPASSSLTWLIVKLAFQFQLRMKKIPPNARLQQTFVVNRNMSEAVVGYLVFAELIAHERDLINNFIPWTEDTTVKGRPWHDRSLKMIICAKLREVPVLYISWNRTGYFSRKSLVDSEWENELLLNETSWFEASPTWCSAIITLPPHRLNRHCSWDNMVLRSIRWPFWGQTFGDYL